jgi:hypothetical protein
MEFLLVCSAAIVGFFFAIFTAGALVGLATLAAELVRATAGAPVAKVSHAPPAPVAPAACLPKAVMAERFVGMRAAQALA